MGSPPNTEKPSPTRRNSSTSRPARVSASAVAPAGSTPSPDGSDPQAALVEVMYAITPVDDHRTMDFWAVSRDFLPDDAETSAFSERSAVSVASIGCSTANAT